MKNQLHYLYPIALLLLLYSCGNKTTDTSAAPPNILWIIAEDLSPDLPSYGYPGVYTPNLDALATDGMRFTRVFTTGPACTPSRTALAVGMHQSSINAHHMRYPNELMNDLPEGIIPINELFRRQGYLTANIKDGAGTGKSDWSFRSPLSPYDTQHWDALSPDKPFFAVVNLRLTHRPFEADTEHPVDPASVQLPPYYPDHPVAREDFAAYLESAQLMDRQVGDILGELEKRGFADNTIVVFFSDHGRPMSRAKNYLFDSGLQIPVIVRAPEKSNWREWLPAGSVNEELISAIDLSATSLTFAGIERPDWMQGRVFLGPQRDEARTAVFATADRLGESHFKSRMVRTDRWKYMRHYRRELTINEGATAYRKSNHPIYHLLNIYHEKGLLTPAQLQLVEPLPEEALYDLEADPYEVHNLANNPNNQKILTELKQELADWQTAIHDHGMEEDPVALQEAFVEYGRTSAEKNKERIAKMEAEVRRRVEEGTEQ